MQVEHLIMELYLLNENEELELFWRNRTSIPQIKGKDIQKVIQRLRFENLYSERV